VTKRQQLRQFLLQEIENLKVSMDDSVDDELLTTLDAAVSGLENLEFGQIDEIFAPADVGLHGLRPATVKLCQARAIGFVLRLSQMGKSVGDAEQIVAEQFVISVDALQQWKKTIGKTTDPRLQAIIKSYAEQTGNVFQGPPIEKLLVEMKRVAAIYKEAKGSKSVKKT
jgi:hypothetical protein